MDISAIGEVVLAFICFCFGLLLIMFFIGLISGPMMFFIFKATGNLKDEWKDKDMREAMSYSLGFYKRAFIPAFCSFYYDKGKNLLKQIKG